MSRDMLSQEEIDALLRANNLSDEEEEQAGGNEEALLTPFEEDALGEIGNISFGSAATALSTLLNQKVDITTPTVTMIKRSELQEEFPQPNVAVHVEYTDGFQGINLLVIHMADAAVIADLMMGGLGKPESTDLSEFHISAVQEAMNQMMGSAATSMSTIFNKLVNISPPGIDIMDLQSGAGTENLPEEEDLVRISFRLKVGEQGELIDSTIMQLLPVSFAKQMIDMLMGTSSAESSQNEVAASQTIEAPVAPPQPAPASAAPVQPSPAAAVQPGAGQAAYPGQAQPPYPGQPMDGFYQQAPGYPPYPYPPYPPYPGQSPVHMPQQLGGLGTPAQPANVQPAQFAQFEAGRMTAEPQNLNLLLDIPLQVTVELGRTRKLIKEILELSAGSIIQLDKLAGEPVDILVNNKLIAKGEVVVIDENFGVRVTDIISQWDRVQKLQ
ncbi:flagellar motor switch phosphatase FliY [Brevibacillus fulvus]|uniref:Flagellar motor switch protein FliN/FliY n=1 Tax=Brevibacillus fulvus TaxID=1125967 RepID=A0A938XV11_9BACL|nr:flagellar motor switch phosphatase FliY [Brevibacillus fulvus]MBM7590617.1 flagellar motor switch protein FliN/FliY [Brevibacillus fulvus]